MSCQSLSKFTESMSHCSFRLIVRLLCVIKILLVKYECLNVFLSSRQMSQHGHQSDVSYSKMFYAKSVKQHWCCKTVNIAVSFATQTQILKCATMEAQPGAPRIISVTSRCLKYSTASIIGSLCTQMLFYSIWNQFNSRDAKTITYWEKRETFFSLNNYKNDSFFIYLCTYYFDDRPKERSHSKLLIWLINEEFLGNQRNFQAYIINMVDPL